MEPIKRAAEVLLGGAIIAVVCAAAFGLIWGSLYVVTWAMSAGWHAGAG